MKQKLWHTRNGYTITRLLAGRSNVFLLSDHSTNILIDSGPKRKWKILNRQIKKLEKPQVDLLILTHAHFDHAGNAARLKKTFGCKVFIHKAEVSYLKDGKNPPLRGNLFFRFLTDVFLNRLKILRFDPCLPDFETDFIDLSSFGFNAHTLHTPGHTTGSVSLIVDNEIAIAGDALFGVFKSSVSPPFYDDQKEMVRSREKLLKTGCSLFLPSHGGEKTRSQVVKDFDKMR